MRSEAFLKAASRSFKANLASTMSLNGNRSRFAITKSQRLDEMPRMVVVNAAHGDPAPQQDIGVDGHIGARIDQTAEYIAAAGPQHL